MKTERPPHTPLPLETSTMRELLARISDAALSIEFENSLEQAAKLTSLIVNLTKTIRETESHNEKLANTAKEGVFTGTLDERLKGYKPTEQELEEMRSELIDSLEVLAPRVLDVENTTL